MPPLAASLLLVLGEPPRDAAAEALSVERLGDAYELASRLARGGRDVRGVYLDAAVLTASAVRLAAQLRQHRPELDVWIGGEARGHMRARVRAAIDAGARAWVGAVPESAQAPRRAQPEPAEREPAPAHREAPGASANSGAILVQTDKTKPRKADNAGAGESRGKFLEHDPAGRYDALSSQPLLSDDELKALLEPTRGDDSA